jgi:hypothetical protein
LFQVSTRFAFDRRLGELCYPIYLGHLAERAASLTEKRAGDQLGDDRPFYMMLTDAYERFCITLEKPLTKQEIAGPFGELRFENVKFSDTALFWCSVATRSY